MKKKNKIIGKNDLVLVVHTLNRIKRVFRIAVRNVCCPLFFKIKIKSECTNCTVSAETINDDNMD